MTTTTARLIIAYKNFAAHKGVSHIGLGVSGINNVKSLRRHGVDAEVWPIVNAAELRDRLDRGRAAGLPVTHVVISAPWIPSPDIQRLSTDYPATSFAINCHSNVGFLQADSNGVRLMREAMEIERGTHNVHLAGNSEKFCRWIRNAFNAPCTYLPNLYYLTTPPPRKRTRFQGGTLRIGAFGATRPLKNFMSAAGAALELAQRLRTDLELWVSAGRTEGGGDTILNAARAMFHGLPNARLIENGWQSWPRFRQTVQHMHLLLQPSYTESFNMVTADGIAEGVPSVVSHAIDWAPEDWKACVDEVSQIAAVGHRLLKDPTAHYDGWQALAQHNKDGLKAWSHFLHPWRRPLKNPRRWFRSWAA
jgi:hypothetical protein